MPERLLEASAELTAIREVPLPLHDPPPPGGGAPERPDDHRAGLPIECGHGFPRQFAVLLAEGLAGARPVRQLTPWLSSRSGAQLRRLLPLFADGRQPRVLRVLTASPAPDVVEMTMVVQTGGRTRALAVRLEHARARGTTGSGEPTAPRGKLAAQWVCTDIEAA
jgi:hypothetical protein